MTSLRKLFLEGVIQDFRFTTDYKFKSIPSIICYIRIKFKRENEWISENDGDLHLLEKAIQQGAKTSQQQRTD